MSKTAARPEILRTPLNEKAVRAMNREGGKCEECNGKGGSGPRDPCGRCDGRGWLPVDWAAYYVAALVAEGVRLVQDETDVTDQLLALPGAGVPDA